MAADAPPSNDVCDLLRQILDAVTAPPPPPVLPLTFKPAGAVQHTGISRSALYRAVAGGHLALVEVPGSGRVFRRSDLDAFVAKLKPARRRAKTA